MASAGRLRRSDCAGPGIRRRRRGRGFSFEDGEGRRIEDEETLERIRALVVPPAWEEVWICADPFGHIQATGVDAAGRKQYRYHDRWELRRAARKYEQMREFARQLPNLRRAVSRDLALEGMPRERALACAVRLLDLGFFRVGGEEYAETNESYGLATIQRQHVAMKGEEMVFDFPAKSGQRRVQSAERPATGNDVGDRTALARRGRSPADDHHVVGDRREHRELAIQNRLAVDHEGAFVASAEAGRETAGENGRTHLHVTILL